MDANEVNFNLINNFTIILYTIYKFFFTLFIAFSKQSVVNEPDTAIIQPSKVLEYADKYMDYIESTSNKWVFTEEEQSTINSMTMTYYNDTITKYNAQCKEYTEQVEIMRKRMDATKPVVNNEDMGDGELNETVANCPCCNTKTDSDSDSESDEEEDFLDQIAILSRKIDEIEQLLQNTQSIMKEATDNATQYVINKNLERLTNCYVMDKSPIGNIIMTYDVSTESFVYYCDNTIPYRFLQTVARKYVKTFQCRPIYRSDKDTIENVEPKSPIINVEPNSPIINVEPNSPAVKTTVFAKLKSYNTVSKQSSMVPQKSNSTQRTTPSSGAPITINTNRYTSKGKIANFLFLKKINKKECNKKLGMRFADFKKLSSE